MKYVVYFEHCTGCYAEEVFTSKEDAEKYVSENENCFIIETEGDWELVMVY